MNTAITKSEKEALDELFLAMKENENFLKRLQNSRKNMLSILKTLFIKSKTSKNF